MIQMEIVIHHDLHYLSFIRLLLVPFTKFVLHFCVIRSIHSFIQLIHPFIHSFIHPFIYSFIHSFIHSFIPFIHSLILTSSLTITLVAKVQRIQYGMKIIQLVNRG